MLHLGGAVGSGAVGGGDFIPPDDPDESICDRVYFLFNNVSKTNLEEKSMELCEILHEGILVWFAYYFVSKRVTMETNFQELFATVLDYVQQRLPRVRPLITVELFRNVKASFSTLASISGD